MMSTTTLLDAADRGENLTDLVDLAVSQGHHPLDVLVSMVGRARPEELDRLAKQHGFTIKDLVRPWLDAVAERTPLRVIRTARPHTSKRRATLSLVQGKAR
ncbi:hypothetical protein [Amycolatopsis pithecellobii]|uniref:Uncharacterized protein n=1 Tax=Amycolatopsis pithecellobii TaxID=664692 RepID=A0A6N7Z277_9PSEU|nr:hypothetical protein [Amycolatopsis pithecellobii]MTD55693.1 hypothetical protein [Amycolatopsis pithecellobii]